MKWSLHTRALLVSSEQPILRNHRDRRLLADDRFGIRKNDKLAECPLRLLHRFTLHLPIIVHYTYLASI